MPRVFLLQKLKKEGFEQMKITIDEFKKMAEKAGVYVLEDFYVVLASDRGNIPISAIGCMDEPPYETFYSKKEVERAIKILTKSN